MHVIEGHFDEIDNSNIDESRQNGFDIDESRQNGSRQFDIFCQKQAKKCM